MKTKSPEISNIEQLFEAVGVTANTLRDSEKQTLDQQGYLILENVIDPKWLKELRDGFENLAAKSRESAGNQSSQESGTRHVVILPDDGPIFERIYTNAQLLAAVYHILKREMKLSGMHGRDPLPGFGAQGLHADWVSLVPGELYEVVTSIWYLDDASPETGSTRLVPGSHRYGFKPDKKSLAPTGTYPGQLQITAKAGSVLIFNGHLWHSGTMNRSKAHRRSIICGFVGRENNRYAATPVAEAGTLSPAGCYLAGL